MSKFLYRNSKNQEISAHSYSGSNEWSCPKRYFYKKIQGYMSRDDRSSLEFGKALESAVQFFHQNDFEPGVGVKTFREIWKFYEGDSSLMYTGKDGNWEDLNRVGSELLALYEVKYKSLPVQNARFQINLKKELFPDTEYAGLEFQGFIDMISIVEHNHPLLPPIEGLEGNREVVIDIKTAGLPYSDNQALYKLDGQLRDYAFLSEIPTVAFMVFVKNRSGIGASDMVTTLREFPILPAGSEVYVLTSTETNVIIVKDRNLYEKYVVERDEIKGTGSKAKKDDLLTQYVLSYGITIPIEYVTKQKIQFLAAIIPKEDQLEAGQLVGKEAIEISEAFQNDNFPKKPGVRFPSAICQNCDALGLCLNDKDLIKQRLIKIDGTF